MQRVVVVGAGISGLTAARDLAGQGYDVLVLEQTDRVGGKLRRGEVAGVTVDVGAEAMINRRPEGVDLATALDLPVVHPTTATSRVWTRGGLRPLPRTLMGAPLDLDGLERSGVLSEPGLARARQEPTLPATEGDGDMSVGALVDQRYGPEVTDRLVEPLLGGVYAGRAREISAQAAIPQLLALARGGSVVARAGAVAGPVGTAQQPVFAGVEGGMWRLPEALSAQLPPKQVAIRTGTTVLAVRRTPEGFVVETDRGVEPAAGVVLATPATPTARLLAELAPVAAGELAQIEYASTSLVTLAFRADDAPTLDSGASGFLVPPVESRRIKAATFSFAKWEWVRAAGRNADEGRELLVVRASLGRHGEEQTLQVPDDELVAASLADLADATGVTAPPVDAVVQRWGGGLPQYAVGHRDRVARIGAAVARVPGLAVCGAAYEGVGIAACIASGHRAAEEVEGSIRAERARE